MQTRRLQGLRHPAERRRVGKEAGLVLKFKVQDALKAAVRRIRQFAYTHTLATRRPRPTRPRVGLALGGGFARGLAHLGVLKVFVEHHVPIDAIAGTSVGSIVAAAFAGGATFEEMVEVARGIRWKDFARWTIPRLGFATSARMEAMLGKILRCARFEDLTIPLVVVAADISTGEAVTFQHGPLIPPLRASCSFPGLFVPVEIEGRMLVDGAIVGSVPVAALRSYGVDRAVAVYLKSGSPHHTPTNIFQVVGQAFQIAQSLNQAVWRKDCDLVIEPDVTDFNWDDFERADELVLAGEQAARRALPALLELVKVPPAVHVAPPAPRRDRP